MADDKRDAMLKATVRREFLERCKEAAADREQDVSEWLRSLAVERLDQLEAEAQALELADALPGGQA